MARSPAKSPGRKGTLLRVSPRNTVDRRKAEETKQQGDATPSRKRSRSESSHGSPAKLQPSSPPAKWRSPRRCLKGGGEDANGKITCAALPCSPKSPRKRLFGNLPQKPKWNPRDPVQMKSVKEALHVSTAPATVLCREEEQKRILEFCKNCIEHEEAGSMYVCGCPGTGKTLSVENVKGRLSAWTKEVGFLSPDVLIINCTSLTATSEIFSKILKKYYPRKMINGICSPVQQLQNLFSQKKEPSFGRMMLVIIDEMDYLITKDRAVLHDLFMLTTYPFSRFVLIGIANSIDLADRFLPRLESLNCKPVVVTFRAYSKDQILNILQQRLMVLGYDVFEPLELEFCARKVAAASGDMRRALGVCMSAIEMFEIELRNPTLRRETEIVTFDHMDIALSKAFKSGVVNTIQSLPQHQQIILCALVKVLRGKKNFTTIGELNKAYADICKSVQVPAAGMTEFSNMCRVISDQGLLKLGSSREEKLKRATLPIDSADVNFALMGIRFFRNCLH